MLILLVLGFRFFIAEPFVVRGESMEPSFYEGDYLWIEKITPRLGILRRGEVIVFRAPDNPFSIYIKRIIGLPGERVRIKGGHIYISRDREIYELEEPYLRSLTEGSADVTLGEDEFFVLGDNRPASEDSRMFGPIKKRAIVGRVWIKLFPWSEKGVVKIPEIKLKKVSELPKTSLLPRALFASLFCGGLRSL